MLQPTDNEGGLPQLWNTSQDAYEKQFPSLSASNSLMPKGKRRTRIDLSTTCEEKSEEVQNTIPLQLHASNSINDQKDTGLPTSFEKNCLSKASISINDQNDTDLPTSYGKNRSYSSKNPKLHQTYHEHGEAKRSSMSSFSTTIDEPFDICLPETRESNSLRSSVNEKNRGKWVKKVQSSEENEQNRDNMENSDNIEDSTKETGQVLRPGMVLFKNYISLSEQVVLLRAF